MKFGDTFYYQDELNDEVGNFKITPKKIDEKYKYIHKNPFYNILAFVTYNFIMRPYAFINIKLCKGIKFENTKVLKNVKKSGYFIYANHTNQFSDAYSPALLTAPKKPYLIANADNVSMPVIGHFTPMWGALPLPDTMEATRNFYKAIECRLNQKQPIIIYPEARLWPYYTKIKPFKSVSFRYPVKYDKPVFVFTTTYQKPKRGKKPKIVIYVDGPFLPDKALDAKAAQELLRNIVYDKMVERSKNSNYEYIKYIKSAKGEHND